MSEQNENYGDYSVDDEDQPGAEDTAEGLGADEQDPEDPLDPGYSPPERYSAGQGYGNTPWEEAHGESLEQRERQEIPEPDPYAEAGRVPPETEDIDSGEVGEERAGRLADPGQEPGDAPADEDTERGLVGEDVGIDGAAASAEEAAVHVVPEEPPEQ